MTIAYLALSFLAVPFLTHVSMGYFLSGCLLFNQQDFTRISNASNFEFCVGSILHS